MSRKEAPLKSAYELALERLAAQDRQSGVAQPKPLQPAQKREIARLREEGKAKRAEIEIMYRKNVEGAEGDPDKLRVLDEHREIDRRRVESWLEERIAEVKASTT